MHDAVQRGMIPQRYVPHNLLVLTLSRFNRKTLVVHLVNIPRGLHVAQNVILQLRDRLQGIPHVLVLLDVPDDFRSLCPLGKVNQVSLLDDRGYAVLDEREIRQIYACSAGQ